MKRISNHLLMLGLFLLAYAVFSNFHGEVGVAFKCIRSKTLLTAANSLLLLSLIASVRGLCKKD